jgi:hypothetical protein
VNAELATNLFERRGADSQFFGSLYKGHVEAHLQQLGCDDDRRALRTLFRLAPFAPREDFEVGVHRT